MALTELQRFNREELLRDKKRIRDELIITIDTIISRERKKWVDSGKRVDDFFDQSYVKGLTTLRSNVWESVIVEDNTKSISSFTNWIASRNAFLVSLGNSTISKEVSTRLNTLQSNAVNWETDVANVDPNREYVAAGTFEASITPPATPQPEQPYTRQSAYDIYKSITGKDMPDDANSRIWADSIIKVLNGDPATNKSAYSLSAARNHVLEMLEGGGVDVNGDGAIAGERVQLTLDQVKQYYEASGLDKVGADKFPPPEESLRTLNLALSVGASSGQGIKTLDDVYKYLMDQGEKIRAAGTQGGNPDGDPGTPGTNPGTTSQPDESVRGNKPYRLVSGTGPALANDTLRGNGNAVFIVSDSGELFHVTETLANELRANGWWYKPEELPQDEVDKMTLRTSLTYTAELGVLDMKPAGDYLLVRGNGAALSNSQLRGNSDAVFAVDKNGNMFHVTEAVAKEMQANNTWMTPAMLNQQTVDSMKISGALTNAAGGTTPTLSIQPGTPVPTVMPAAGGASGATGNPANPASATYKLVRGNGPNLGTTQLLGNGAAVYALFEDGTKLHVTEAMAKELDAAGKWYEPQQLEQSEIDKTPPAGRLLDINGGRGPLTVDYVAGGATTPTTSTPVPATTPDGPKASDRSKELVQATFRQYFGKDGTAAEVEAYALDMDNGRSLNVIRAEISAKPEAASFREDLIQQTFQQFVGRAADANDLRIHNEKLMSGEVTPEQFRIGIANAQEAVDWQNAQVAGVSGQAQSMYGEAIQNIYRQQLGRDASPEELRMHTAALSDGSLNLQQLTDQVYWSPEGSAFRGEPVTSVGPGSSVAEPAPVAGPTWTPDVQYDRTGASRDLNDPKYGYNDARKQELRVHMWNQGTWEEIATIEDIYASGDAGRIDAWERFSQTGKYAPGASQPQQPTVASAAPAPAPAATVPSPSAVHGDAVRAAYRQYLGREAGQNEVDHWAGLAAGGANIVGEIAGSAEAAGYRQQIVRDTFRLYVCREPSAEDMAIHTDRLARGEVTPEQFRLSIVNAPEATINQNWLWAQQSPAAQAMYREAINGIFVRQTGQPATDQDVRIHTAGLVNGLTNLQKLEENIASAVQNQGRLVKSGQVLGASTTVPMSSGLNVDGGTTAEDKPDLLTESAGSSDEDAIWVTDSAGVRRDISSLSWEKRAEVQKHVVEGGGSFSQLDQIENIYASGDASAIENWERFSQTGKYSPSTPWGQTYQSVIKDGYSHELASAWADGSHADNMQAATTPVPGVAPAAAPAPNPNSFGVL